MLDPAPTLIFEMAPPRGDTRPDSIGLRIRRFRLAKGLTQTELGHRAGLSKRMVAYYEIQGGMPSTSLLVRLAETLGVSLAMLAGKKEPTEASLPAPESVRLWRRFKRLSELPSHDRKTILKMIDAMADARRRAS